METFMVYTDQRGWNVVSCLHDTRNTLQFQWMNEAYLSNKHTMCSWTKGSGGQVL